MVPLTIHVHVFRLFARGLLIMLLLLLKVIEACNKAEQWLREKSQQQDSLPKNTDPVLWSGEIKKKADALDAYVQKLP